MTAVPVLLQARGLVLERPDGRGGPPRRVLQALDLAVRGGEVLMLMGPNGAGKSTLLAALAGDLRPAAGHITLHGRALADWRPAELARLRAVLPQRAGLGMPFLAREVVRLGCWARDEGRLVIDAIVAQAMEATAATALAGRNVLELSGGEQARVHLARVLAQVWPWTPAYPAQPHPLPRATGAPSATARPCVLLLDEPCASLDPRHQHAVCALARDFARHAGAGVVMTMHDINLAAQYADRIAVLAQGRLALEGSAREVLTQDGQNGMAACFGVEVDYWPLARERFMAATRPLNGQP